MTLFRQLNPRLHLAAAIGWAVFAVVTLAGLIAANLAAAEAERRARADVEGMLAEIATQVRDALSMNLETRRSVLQATAAQISAAGEGPAAAMSRTLDATRGQFPEFVWMGVVDAGGRVAAGTDAVLSGESVMSAPWFQQGRLRPYVSDAHVFPSGPAQALSPQGAGSVRLLDFAVPLDPSLGPRSGVLASYVEWAWVERVVAKMQDALSKRRQFELMLAGRDGAVLLGPPQWQGRKPVPERDLTEGGTYAVGTRTQLRLADGLGLGWTAIVRQRADLALAPVRTIRRTVFTIVFLAGLLAAACAAIVGRVFTRRLSSLTQDAEAVRRGEHRFLTPLSGVDEVSRIGGTLSELVEHLQTEKQSLQTLNWELDRRVAERTLRIERMADETRHAAVTRERLRIARDLHDTLAHSLMALLTQVRLVRKLHTRMTVEELDAELARAEEVTSHGLSEARAAIRQIRANGVMDTGLGPALHDLAKRFEQRTGVAATVEADAHLGTWADDRAETVFRIVEEALRNVERHAQAKAVRISLRPDEAEQVIEIRDDGIGFDAAESKTDHYGLRGMQEQAALISARWAIESRKGQGTRVLLGLPAEQPSELRPG